MNLKGKTINLFNDKKGSQFSINQLPGHTSLSKFYSDQIKN